jgi:hypothetical protein
MLRTTRYSDRSSAELIAAAQHANKPCPTVSDAEDLEPGETLPTPQEIAEGCRLVRLEWSKRERRKRMRRAWNFPARRVLAAGVETPSESKPMPE